MELELKEARELEKSNRSHLQSSRDMIGSLQETVSQLVYLKRDVQKLKYEINSKDITIANINKMNVVVLEYEEKIQRSASEISQLQDKLAMQTSINDANIDAYRRKIEDLEGKLKQCQFKEYLAQNSFSSQMENRVERPYSMSRDYSESSEMNSAPLSPRMSGYSRQKPTLQVVYDNGTLPKNEKKSHFNITKKRKLYNDKDFLNH
ncbi:unnamed protein product [Danaus chrysippus]|uniref:(African queen) hypothetical protein n=1 Tax=Danaus chrysippus TaxID=151541 RepID=A0A8J2R8D0_9NEOP|nr:unnamed protein product [Danaus chrysippus]